MINGQIDDENMYCGFWGLLCFANNTTALKLMQTHRFPNSLWTLVPFEISFSLRLAIDEISHSRELDWKQQSCELRLCCNIIVKL